MVVLVVASGGRGAGCRAGGRGAFGLRGSAAAIPADAVIADDNDGDAIV